MMLAREHHQHIAWHWQGDAGFFDGEQAKERLELMATKEGQQQACEVLLSGSVADGQMNTKRSPS